MSDGDRKCPVCGGMSFFAFFERQGMPVHSCILWKTRQEALAAPVAAMELAFCERCAHIFNPGFDSAKLGYSEEYENSLHHSPMFRAYADEEIDRLNTRLRLAGKVVVDVGCGKGDFLARMVEIAKCAGIGFDVSYDGRHDGWPAGSLQFHREYYTPERFPMRADLVCNRQVLEHIENPVAFLKMVARGLAEPGITSLYLEVPDAAHMLESFGYWDLLYEHVSIFTDMSLEYALRLSGLRSTRLRKTFHEMFLVIEGQWSGELPSSVALPPQDRKETVKGRCARFRRGFDEKLKEIESRIENTVGKGKSVVAWGAGARGNTFLNLSGIGTEIRYIVDVNPAKIGFYMGGSGQRIIAPAALKEIAPDEIWVINPVYEKEIRDQVRAMGLESEVKSI